MPATQLDQDSKNRLTKIKEALCFNTKEVSRSIEVEESLLNQMIDLLQSRQRTPKGLRTTTSGSLNEIVYSFSVYNTGATNGVIQGIVIKPGERLHWGAGAVNNFYEEGEIVYDATGTELLIIYNA